MPRKPKPVLRQPTDPSDRIGAGNHPYYCVIHEDGSWAVVRTSWGVSPVVVERGFKSPKEAITRTLALNAGE